MALGLYEAQLEYLAKQTSDPLLKAPEFAERMGLQLDDHCLAARNIAKGHSKN
ncbi:hypothetical protein BN2476_670004 [Paraburkholderia piptadeniae]|uniref:Uncharacterized protein n=1 Tax=Paraburkholderia piptadeniae TaxID=1701573 RepID=A0A1N7SNG6_9BURK|nr:hypothetical protein [Paraburkholderia piptadeniae]SIT48913.1 hypothetical protein BN2476_670004 [Paraburkholderia piptadeniae]